MEHTIKQDNRPGLNFQGQVRPRKKHMTNMADPRLDLFKQVINSIYAKLSLIFSNYFLIRMGAIPIIILCGKQKPHI